MTPLHSKHIGAFACYLSLLLAATGIVVATSDPIWAEIGTSNLAEQSIDTSLDPASQKKLEKTARDSFRRLKYAVKNDGFYSARVSLNIWRIAAINAGTFDAQIYEQYKKDIYEASIEHNLGWFENFLIQGDFHNAETCLNIWRIHSKEIDTFSQEQFDEMGKRLTEAKLLNK
jgi:hypothetical protein